VSGTDKQTNSVATRRRSWGALRHRNFKLFLAGQGISVIGTWMTRLAATWLVYRLTHSVWMLGVIGFAGQIVSFALGPVAGVWVERMERRRLLVWTQAAASAQALALAVLALTHVITLWEVLALTVVQGIINAFDMPARQSFLVQMVDDRNDLTNAIALNSLLANGARLIGPAIAGAVVAAAGEGWCFLVDGISYLAVIASLLLMRIRPMEARTRVSSVMMEMREGWEYVRGHTPIRTILLLFALVSLLGYPFTVLLPAFASDVLHGGARTLGWLSGAAGVGTMISTLLLASRKSVVGLPRVLRAATAMLGVAVIFFGLSHTLWLSMLLLAVVGFGLMQGASASNTIIQSLVSEDKRARVMSYYTMAFFGGAPFGSLLIGALADRIGVQAATVVTGACCLAGALWFGMHLRGVNAALHVHEAAHAVTLRDSARNDEGKA